MTDESEELGTCKCGDEIDDLEEAALVTIRWKDGNEVEYKNQHRVHHSCAERIRRNRITAPDVMPTDAGEAFCAVCSGTRREMVDKTGQHVFVYIKVYKEYHRDWEYIFHEDCWEKKRSEWISSFEDEEDD